LLSQKNTFAVSSKEAMSNHRNQPTMETTTTADGTANEAAIGKHKMPSVSFPIKELHKKALLKLLHSHHGGILHLTYSDLSLEIGVGEKTKAWQCGAWKHLKQGGFIVPGIKLLNSDRQARKGSKTNEARAYRVTWKTPLVEVKEFSTSVTNRENLNTCEQSQSKMPVTRRVTLRKLFKLRPHSITRTLL
jgi:hypothetical protein